MSNFAKGRTIWAAVSLLAVSTLAWLPVQAQTPYVTSEVLLEGGVAMPEGDLGSAFHWFEPGKMGLGAETGYEVGFRFRYYFSRTMAASGSFHYVDFANFLGSDEIGGFEVATSILRYAIDLNLYMAPERASIRPFIILGAVLNNNRYRDYDDYDQSYYKTSIFSLGGAGGIGLRMGIFEISGIYNYNRFQTVRLDPEGMKKEYDWDYIMVQAAFAFPTY
jgi:hypothetical protein